MPNNATPEEFEKFLIDPLDRINVALQRAVRFLKVGYGSSDLVSQPGDLPDGEIYFAGEVLLVAEVFELEPLEVIGLVLGPQVRVDLWKALKKAKAVRHG